MASVLARTAAILSLVAANPAAAALAVGDAAPDFSADAAQGKTTMALVLSDLRKSGPVVIFFFPSAYTDAAECRDFAENSDKFRAAGASVVGVSRDSVETLARLSADECGGAVPLASANEALVNAFDVNDGAMFTTRATYVVSASGKIAFVNADAEFGGHAKSALAFVQALKH